MTRGPTPEEFFAQEFAKLEKEYTADHLPALVDTLQLAQMNGLPLPKWCAVALGNLVIDRFNAKSGKKRRSKYVIDYVHRRRWDTLSATFRMRGIKYAKPAGSPKKQARGINEARIEASNMLCKTIASGTPRQIQDSFDLVEEARKAGADARFMFYWY